MKYILHKNYTRTGPEKLSKKVYSLRIFSKRLTQRPFNHYAYRYIISVQRYERSNSRLIRHPFLSEIPPVVTFKVEYLEMFALACQVNGYKRSGTSTKKFIVYYILWPRNSVNRYPLEVCWDRNSSNRLIIHYFPLRLLVLCSMII